MKYFQLATFMLALALSSAVNAGLVVDLDTAIAGMTEDSKGERNDVIGNVTGYYGSQIYTGDAQTILLFEFIGAEAAWHNTFTVSNGAKSGQIVNHPSNGHAQSFKLSFAANTLIDFSFLIGGGTGLQVENGSNAASGANFWAGGWEPGTEISSLLLALDDSGKSFDEDADDLVVRITVSEVPVPPALLLFASALVGLAGLKRRH